MKNEEIKKLIRHALYILDRADDLIGWADFLVKERDDEVEARLGYGQAERFKGEAVGIYKAAVAFGAKLEDVTELCEKVHVIQTSRVPHRILA